MRSNLLLLCSNFSSSPPPIITMTRGREDVRAALLRLLLAGRHSLLVWTDVVARLFFSLLLFGYFGGRGEVPINLLAAH